MAAAWDDLTLGQQRAVIQALVTITITPAGRVRRPDRAGGALRGAGLLLLAVPCAEDQREQVSLRFGQRREPVNDRLDPLGVKFVLPVRTVRAAGGGAGRRYVTSFPMRGRTGEGRAAAHGRPRRATAILGRRPGRGPVSRWRRSRRRPVCVPARAVLLAAHDSARPSVTLRAGAGSPRSAGTDARPSAACQALAMTSDPASRAVSSPICPLGSRASSSPPESSTLRMSKLDRADPSRSVANRRVSTARNVVKA